MTKSSMRRLASHPFLIRTKSSIKVEGKEPYKAIISFYAWPISEEKTKAIFARCRIVRENEISYGDTIEIDRKNIIEVRRI